VLLAGGDAMQEAADALVIVPALADPAWRFVVWSYDRLEILPPGVAPGAGETLFDMNPRWDRDGLSILFWSDGAARRRFVETGRTQDVVAIASLAFVGASPKDQTIYATELVAHVRRELITNYGDFPRPWAKR
jgi:hypothetical protein